MAFELEHFVLSESFTPTLHTTNDTGFCTVRVEGEVQILHTGRLQLAAIATFQHRVRVERPPGPDEDPGTPPHGGFETVTHPIPLKFTLYRPDGHELKRRYIRLADLRAFRDLRGLPRGTWRYEVSGESQHFALNENDRIFGARGWLTIGVQETVASRSAGPLIDNAPLSPHESFEFDLFRVGTFVAELSNLTDAEWRGTTSLYDPDGSLVASSWRRTLSFPVELATLAKSRAADGSVRRWRLEVSAQGGVIVYGGAKPTVSATVIGSGRITIEALQSRIDALLGPRGEFIKIYGENAGGEMLARLVIEDPVAAETIDMRGLLEKRLKSVDQDPPADPEDVQAHVVYTLARESEGVENVAWLDVSSLRVGTIDASVGPGVQLGAAALAVRLNVAVSGEVKVKLGPATIGTASVRGGRFEMEVGIVLAADGTPQLAHWLSHDPFDLELNWWVLAALPGSAPLIAFGEWPFRHAVELILNGAVAAGARDLFADPTLAPRILMMVFGAHLSYRSIRIENGVIVFDHDAPLEPDPRPRPGYAGAIGRRMIEVTPGRPQFQPPLLPDTWAAGNLAKIDHIVVVMMENRSYDHVLGYRAQGAEPDGADGLTQATIDAIQATDAVRHTVRKLSEAGFARNKLGKMTRIPTGVGHKVADVREQLAAQAQREDGGGQINHPKGFVDNFEHRLDSLDDSERERLGVVPQDVLGYYEADDLPFYAYLARHYAYCDRYYCSHPGPTLPNRMYSLTGDLQYDRFGVPILDNNDGDNLLLSRATTIYDLLTRKGVSWRVYESAPSVTMLRMFARYATNTTDIVDRARLSADVAADDLPSFTFVEPAMHHHPQNDDHPDADMYRGQIFLKEVYDTLRSNQDLWRKTLLLITYDEHGGLYDHVVPPVADHLSAEGSGGYPGTGALGVGPRITAGNESDAGDAARRRDDDDEDPGPDPGPGPDPDPGPGPRPDPGEQEEPLPGPSRDPVYIRYGVRVPTFVVSPWVKPGKGPSMTLDHCSILKTVLARFCGSTRPFLSDRVNASQNFDAFLTEPEPRTDVPASPELGELPIDVRRVTPGASQIITPPLSRKRMREGDVDYHDISGWLARMLGR